MELFNHDLEHYELKALNILETKTLEFLGRVAVRRFEITGILPAVRTNYILEPEDSQWGLKLIDNDLEVRVPMGVPFREVE